MIEVISLDEKGRDLWGLNLLSDPRLAHETGDFLSTSECAFGTEPYVTLLSSNCRAHSVTALTPMAMLTRYCNCAFVIDEIGGCALLDEMTALRLPNPMAILTR